MKASAQQRKGSRMLRIESLRRNKGYTLIELLIVVVIIGVIAALAIPRFMAASSKPKTAEAMSILKQVHVQQRAYRQEYGAYWGNGIIADKNTPQNFSRLGVDIMSSARYTYTMAANQTSYTCTAEANIDDDATVDTWTISGDGQLLNTVDDFTE